MLRSAELGEQARARARLAPTPLRLLNINIVVVFMAPLCHNARQVDLPLGWGVTRIAARSDGGAFVVQAKGLVSGCELRAEGRLYRTRDGTLSLLVPR